MATISSDILASYAADLAREVDGVRGVEPEAVHVIVAEIGLF